MKDLTDFNFIWQPIKQKMKESLSYIVYLTYIEKLVPVDVEGRTIVLQGPTWTLVDFLMNNHYEQLRDAVISAGVGMTNFRFVVEGEFQPREKDRERLDQIAPRAKLNENYTFEQFVVGKNNEFAQAAAFDVANNLAATYNPLFIYGGTGLGKTHLMQAIANHVIKTRPELNVIYVTCEQFVNEIIDTMFTSKGPDARERGQKLRNFYRSADLLIIDDIQFIEKKKSVQEEFFHTFNELVAKGKQIVISSDHPPKELQELEERLATRFSGGLICDILPPDFETKVAILKKKAFEKKAVVPEDVYTFLAQNSDDDIRTLEGRLTKVIFASRLKEEPITIDLARRALNESALPAGEKEPVNIEGVLNGVITFYHISREDLTGRSKKKEFVIPRQICCYLMCELLQIPLVAIGQVMGGKDHTTIMHSRDKVEAMIKMNDHIAKVVDDIKNIILKQ